MKVLYLSHTGNNMEGSSIALLKIIKQMQKRGLEVRVITIRKGNLNDDLEKLGITVYHVPGYFQIWPKPISFISYLLFPLLVVKRFFEYFIGIYKVEQIIREYKPDIFHTNVGPFEIGYHACKRLGVKHIWHIRETDKGLSFCHFPSKTYHNSLLKKNDFNICITKTVKEYYDLQDYNSTIIYDGVFESQEKPKIKPKMPYFLFAGNVSAAKGADVAVNAFLKIAEECPTYELWLAGKNDSDFAQALMRSVANTKYSERIKFLGPRADIYALMSETSAFLMTSVMEAFGFTTVEAMLNGALVIGRNTGGTKEQFDRGLKQTGMEIALRCDNEDDFSRQMLKVCSNGQVYYRDMIERAQDVVMKNYTAEKNAEQIFEIYNKVIK
jgi:glycosyltransferase involved in cell wall biosynthesis